MRLQSIIVAVLAAAALPACGEGTAKLSDKISFLGKPGGYQSELKLMFLVPDKNSWPADNYREARLLEDFEYIDSAGRSWKVPAGYVTDGASIPYGAWSSGIGPYDGPYRDAAVLHDYYCEHKGLGRTWREVQDMFLDASLSRGTSEFTAKVLYAGVLTGRVFGYCTWEEPSPASGDISGKKADASGVGFLRLVGFKDAKDTPPKLSPEDEKVLQALQEWIKRENPSFDEIRKRVEEIKKRQTGRAT
ncbi:MAG: DUF1353 domain-containing protein [Hyphomicrobiaceae bacterium]|nr:DUF1353 domain-containing protein [Hyphomicrobiaceae bacterium]